MNQFSDERIILTIEGIDSKARGIARAEGQVIFVPGALLGEVVLAEIVDRRRHYAIATVKSILKASSYRVEPICEYYEACGGCDLQHASYDYQLSAKEHLIGEAITRIGKWPNVIIEPVAPSPQVWGYRNKAIIHARYQKNRKKLGYFARGTHEVIDIKRCLILDPLINSVYNRLSYIIKQDDITFYDERSSEGLLRHIVIRSSLAKKRASMAWILSRNPRSSELKKLRYISTRFIEELSPFLRGVLVNINTSSGNFVWGTETFLLAGDDDELEEFIGNFNLHYGITDFFQVNVSQAHNICKVVSECIKGNRRVLELYSGVGSITSFLASCCDSVVAVEEWQPACKSLMSNMARNDISNVFLLCEKAEKVIFGKRIEGTFDAVVLDPPRAGCHKDVLRFLGTLGSPKIIYVSCNPATLARDGKTLLEFGYRPVRLLPFDMFPQTSHVESVSIFEL